MTPTTSDAGRPRFADDAGVVYAELIEAELNDQRASKASFEQRGLAVVSTSGALVTALFGLVAFLTKRDDFHISHAATIPLYLALGLFVVAALGGLIVNKPMKYRGLTRYGDLGLDPLIRGRWSNPPAIARRRVAMTRTVILDAYQAKNQRKGRILTGAILAEVAAVCSLAIAVGLILRDST